MHPKREDHKAEGKQAGGGQAGRQVKVVRAGRQGRAREVAGRQVVEGEKVCV